MSRKRILILLFAAQGFGSAPADAQSVSDYERPPIRYSESIPADAFAGLRARLQGGDLELGRDDRAAVVRLLAELGVPPESQILVFSRTSLQRGKIRPDHPRALYFSESTFVGWVPGGLIEVASLDPRLGPIFYSIALPHGRQEKVRIVRDVDCLRCHGDTFVRGIPGVLARSVFPAADGEPLLQFGSTVVDDTTPFADRWGGWYVTGYHGTASHRGNTLGAEEAGRLLFEPAAERPESISGKFESRRYLTQTSDIVALLVFEHQLTVINELTRASLACRRMLDYQRSLQETFKETVTAEPTYDSVRSVFTSSAQAVLDRLLMKDAAALPDGIVGDVRYRAAFLRDARRSSGGHSLKDLSLHGRLFQNRCSFLIYSPLFAELPIPLRRLIIEGLDDALSEDSPSPRYGYLELDERRRIREILRETLPAFGAARG